MKTIWEETFTLKTIILTIALIGVILLLRNWGIVG